MKMPNQKQNRVSVIGQLELFYATGIRLSELVSLNIDSVDHSNKLLELSAKAIKKD